MKVVWILAVALFSLVGCSGGLQPERLGVFPEQEYASLPSSGTGIVTGQVFLKTVGGDVKYGAGNTVSLIPATSYTATFYSAYLKGSELIGTPDSRAYSYVKKTQADGQGNFTFTQVAPGSYYIVGTVTWMIPAGGYAMSQQGGNIMKRVDVSNDQTSTVMITR